MQCCCRIIVVKLYKKCRARETNDIKYVKKSITWWQANKKIIRFPCFPIATMKINALVTCNSNPTLQETHVPWDWLPKCHKWSDFHLIQYNFRFNHSYIPKEWDNSSELQIWLHAPLDKALTPFQNDCLTTGVLRNLNMSSWQKV